MGCLKLWRLHLHPGTDIVITYMDDLTPDLVRGPLHSTSLTSMFIARVNNISEMVHPLMMPFSSQYYADVDVPDVALRLKQLQ